MVSLRCPVARKTASEALWGVLLAVALPWWRAPFSSVATTAGLGRSSLQGSEPAIAHGPAFPICAAGMVVQGSSVRSR